MAFVASFLSAAAQAGSVTAASNAKVNFRPQLASFLKKAQTKKAFTVSESTFAVEASASEKNFNGFAAIAAGLLAIVPSPVFAAKLVGEPLLTEGTGKSLGINDPALVIALSVVFSIIFVAYLSWARDAPDIE